jgi:prolyl oligopeptidase
MEHSLVGAFRLQEDDPILFTWVSDNDSKHGLSFRKPGEVQFSEILPPRMASVSPFYREGDTVYAFTNLNAPRQRVVSIDLKNPSAENWKDIILESQDQAKVLEDAAVADGRLLLFYSRGGEDSLAVHSLQGEKIQDAPIPEGSTITCGQIRPQNKAFQLKIGNFLTPGSQYEYNIADNKLNFIKKSAIPHDLTDIAEVKRLYATSKDGTQIPMWVIQPKNFKKDGSASTILYGYGDWGISLKPQYSFERAHWVEQGGVYVVSTIRGGGEFGKQWQNAGYLNNKQTSFDDFIACAEALIKQGYTNPKRLAIQGGSSGGLLTAAVSQQRPELFGAVISEVPVIDMLRFPKVKGGTSNTANFGDPAKKEDFSFLFKYSPLHTMKTADEIKYPPTLVTTGDHDDRVVPWHSYKWVATRQDKGHHETYLRVDERAGHGAGKPLQKIINESADIHAFLVKSLGSVKLE